MKWKLRICISYLVYSQIWLNLSIVDDCHFRHIFPWMIPTFVTSSHGWLPLWLHLFMDDHHLFSSIGRLSKSGNPAREDVTYIFPWMITTLATSSNGWFPLWLHLPMDDFHFGYIFQWMISTLATSSNRWFPLLLHLPMDDFHFCYIFQWMISTFATSSHGWSHDEIPPKNQKRKRRRRRKRSLRNARKASDFLSFPDCAVWATRDL